MKIETADPGVEVIVIMRRLPSGWRHRDNSAEAADLPADAHAALLEWLGAAPLSGGEA